MAMEVFAYTFSAKYPVMSFLQGEIDQICGFIGCPKKKFKKIQKKIYTPEKEVKEMGIERDIFWLVH